MENYLEPLFVVDPLLLGDFKCYILGNDKGASEMFVQMCSLFVGIEGFICDEYKGTTLWHRPVVAFSDVNSEEAVICIPENKSVDGILANKYRLCHSLMILNPEFDRNKAVIFGAGLVGTQIARRLRSMDMEILCFIDSNKDIVGSQVEEILIHDRTYLEELPADAYVIEAGKFYQEIDKTVADYIGKSKRFFWGTSWEMGSYAIYIDDNTRLDMMSVMSLEEFFENRTLYLYGDYELSKKYKTIIKMLGFQVDIVRDVADNIEEKSIEDLLYEENYIIVLLEEKKLLISRLELLGFREARDYVWIEHPTVFYLLSRIELLDMNLGYAYLMDDKYPGFKVLGKNVDTDYKIVVLGGSTTDAETCTVTSWVDFLYSKCENRNVTIFNGGTSGYNSTMELIKLIRDVLNLNPDMVVVYDGYNDVNTLPMAIRKPYEFTYLRRAISFADKRQYSDIEKSDLYLNQDSNRLHSKSWNAIAKRNDRQINSGWTVDKTPFEIWLNNIELMYAILKSKNISFFSFMQPMLMTKKKELLTLREKSWINARLIAHDEGSQLISIDEKNCRQKMVEYKVTDTHEYIYDLSDIFDTKDVYMDYCHVYEEGNKIIADEIWKVIKNHLNFGL